MENRSPDAATLGVAERTYDKPRTTDERTRKKRGAQTLKRTLGVNDAVLVIISSVIGVGIFLTPGQIAQAVANPYWFLFLWLIGGVIVFSGAMSSAALGTMMPKAGGDYVFLKTTYGKSWGFLYGYLCFIVTFTGSIATYATGVVKYQGSTIFGDVFNQSLISIPFAGVGYEILNLGQLAAIGLVLLFTLINHFGARNSLNIQRFITLVPLFVLVSTGLIIIAFNFISDGEKAGAVLTTTFAGQSPLDVPSLGIISLAMMYIFFSYTGWNAALYLGEDLKTPNKIIPRALMLGMAIIAVVYILFCFVILSTIPYEVLHDKSLNIDIASRAWGVLLGNYAGYAPLIMAVLIAIMILGGLNSSIIAGSRIFFAMARDGLFFSRASQINERSGVPGFSLWAQGIWACLIILVFKDFDFILQYTSIIITFLSIATISSLFFLHHRFRMHEKRYEKKFGKPDGKTPERRYTHPMAPRENDRLFGYPVMPAIYIITTSIALVGYIVSSWENVLKGAIGLITIISSFVIYYLWKRSNHHFARKRRNSSRSSS